MKTTIALAALAAVLGVSQAYAQVTQRTDSPAIAPMSVASVPCCLVSAGTVVELEITDPISSRDRKHGDKFGLRLHAPLMLDGVIVLPAGTTGVGEIVHADRARGGGKPGELILAARYLQLQGSQVPLRGLKLGANGKDNTRKALAFSMAIGVWAQFIHGGEVDIPTGTIAEAKLTQDFTITTNATFTPPVAILPTQAAAPISNPPAAMDANPPAHAPGILNSPTTTFHQE